MIYQSYAYRMIIKINAATTQIGSNTVKNVITAAPQPVVFVEYMVVKTTEPTSTTATVKPTNIVIIPPNAIGNT